MYAGYVHPSSLMSKLVHNGLDQLEQHKYIVVQLVQSILYRVYRVYRVSHQSKRATARLRM